MILEHGDKVLLFQRRLFEEDEPRCFLGLVEGYEGGVVRVKGQAWVRDRTDGSFKPKRDLRVRIVSLASGTLLAYVLPHECDLEAITMRAAPDRGVHISDGDSVDMELAERMI